MRKKNVYGDSTWKDKLTSYNGTTITYDTIGNPLSDGTWSYTWQAGRQLKKMTKSGVTVEFQYDHNGLRTQKKVTQNGVTTTTNYMLHGNLVTHMTVGTDKLHFFFDAQSRPAKVSFNGVIYTYIHNLQGDIIGLLDSNSALVVEYKYDAWGKLLSTTGTKATTLGKLNPYRYRGYVYDEETEMYYCRSRYYSPKVSRFINLDNMIPSSKMLLGIDLFAYCCNTPVNYADPSGHSFKDVVMAIQTGMMGTKNILIKGKNLFTGTGKKYSLYQPPKKTGPTYNAVYKTKASGSTSKTLYIPSLACQNPVSFDEDNQFVSIFNIINNVKNGVAWINMNAYIEEAAGNAPRARVTMQVHLNTSIDHLGTGIIENSTIDSKVLTLVELTSESGVFWDGQGYITFSNDGKWLNKMISEIELTEVAE